MFARRDRSTPTSTIAATLLSLGLVLAIGCTDGPSVADNGKSSITPVSTEEPAAGKGKRIELKNNKSDPQDLIPRKDR